MSTGSHEQPPAALAVPTTSSADLFVRKSTGLVRTINGRQAVLLNLWSAPIAFNVAYLIFFALAAFPGGNFYLAIVLIIPLALTMCYSFGMLTAIIPRSGGDYMLVTRILNPLLGFISTACMAVAFTLSVAFIALFVGTDGVEGSLTTIGLVSHNTTFLHWAADVAAHHWLQYVIAAVQILVAGALLTLGWTWTKRLIFWGMGITLVGWAVSLIIELFTTHSTFIHSFNSFAAPILHTSDPYHSILAAARKQGTNLGTSFSWHDTWGMFGLLATAALYPFFTAFMGGEIREASTLKTAHRMAYAALWFLAAMAITLAIFYKTVSHAFLAAVFSGALPTKLGSTGGYFFLTSVQVGSPVFAWVLCLTFLVTGFAYTGAIILVYSRSIFAWAFDGNLPQAVTTVTKRNVPVAAIWILVIVSLGLTVWGVWGATNFLQIITYTVLLELIAMGLVGVSAIVVPYRRPELFRSSVSTVRVFGVPLVVIAGIGNVLAVGIVWYLYISYPYFGFKHISKFLIFLGITLAAGVLYYVGARIVRARQGVDLGLVYAEIPPE